MVAALLGVAGLAKIRRPGPTAVALRSAGLPGSTTLARIIGATELVVAVLALAVGGPSTALVVAAAYVAFASVSIRLVARSATGGCGCFGDESAPVTNLHVCLNLAAAVLAGLAALWPTDGLPALVADEPAASAILVGLIAVGVGLGQAAFTALPDLLAVSRDAER